MRRIEPLRTTNETAISHLLKKFVGNFPDAADKHLYVGYGDDETAATGIVDTNTDKRLDKEYKTRCAPRVLSA